MITKILAPSILSADFCRLGEQIDHIRQAGAQYVHFDVMDGHFVPNISFGIPVLASVRQYTDLILDVHMMISSPEQYIDAFAKAGADIINFHMEAAEDPGKLIAGIRALGKRPAITIKPRTPIQAVFPYAKDLDMILIMSVEPGFGGQAFNPQALEKARLLREYADKHHPGLHIEMDGGIDQENAREVANAGVNVFVAGSAIFGAKDIQGAVRAFLQEIGR